jgi:hypothetical protein
MFVLRKRIEPPDRPFSHVDDCRILAADPTVVIPWSRLEYGRWRRECVCGAEGWTEPAAERIRLDPLDPSTAHHAGECEFKDVTDPAVLKVLLKVREGQGGGYWWVECGSCATGWQVPFYGSESVG